MIKNPPVNAEDIREAGSIPVLGMQPTPVLLPGKLPWSKEPDALYSIESQRVRHSWSDILHMNRMLISNLFTLKTFHRVSFILACSITAKSL